MTIYRKGALVSALLFMTGCQFSDLDFEMPNLDFEMPALSLGLPTSPQKARLFLAGTFVEGAEGFCIDRSSSRLASGFAVIAPCALLSEDGDMPAHPALITIQMGETGSAAIGGAERSAQDALTAALSLADRSDILETAIQDASVLIHYRLPAAEVIDGLSSELWRALADVDDRLATVALFSYDDAPLSVDEGRRLLSETVDILRNANP
jgi:hypothetical protein